MQRRLGAETLLHLRLDDGTLFTMRQDGTESIPAEGEACGIAWDEVHQMRFDSDGRRL